MRTGAGVRQRYSESMVRNFMKANPLKKPVKID
jgi:hypothetical protein